MGPVVPGTVPITKKSWRTKKSKKARTKHPESNNATSQHRPLPPLQGLNQTSWSPSETSQSGLSVPFSTVVPGYPLYPIVPSAAPPQAPTGITESQGAQATPTAPAYPPPLVTPVVAFVVPSFMLPQIGTAPRSPFYADGAVFPPQQAFNTQNPFQPQQAYNIQQSLQPQQVYSTQQVFQPQQAYSTPQHVQNPQECSVHQSYPPNTGFTPRQPFTPQTPFPYGITLGAKPPVAESAECPSPLPAPHSPPLFESRCSSPLQLDLLQMEEKQDFHSAAPSSSAQGNCRSAQDKNSTPVNSATAAPDDLQQVKDYTPVKCGICQTWFWPLIFFLLLFQACCSGDGGHCGDHSSSSSVLELLLQEDSHSGTGSATSASTGFTSNDCNTSNSGRGAYVCSAGMLYSFR